MGKGLKQILITIQERWAATRPNVYKNKKKCRRHPRKKKYL